ncbi:MAG: hypothetical protein JRG91_03935 [Deltaproteobacteria bacterium]|nr:hypothetical protein [Deltaproteobacteria bacterium]
MDDDLKDMLAAMSPPRYLEEDIDPGEVEIMMREAARLWRAQPWDRLEEFGPMALQAPGLMLTNDCIGLADDQYPALVLTYSYKDYLLAVSIGEDIVADEKIDAEADAPPDSILPLIDAIESKLDADSPEDEEDDRREPLVTLSWVPGSHVPGSLRKEIASQAWEIAGVDAYPVAVRVDPETGLSAPGWMDLRRIAGACAALSGLIESRPGDETICPPFWHTARVQGSKTGVLGRVVCPHPLAVRAADATYRYEAELGPDLELWIQEGMDAMIRDIAQYHVERKPHPLPEGAELHGALHYAAESHLYAGSKEAWDELEEMMITGLSRHDAIHRMGVPLMEKVADIMQAGKTSRRKRSTRKKKGKRPRKK